MGPEEKAWEAVKCQLDFHRRKPHHTWLDTLNRLWRKNRFVMTMDGMLRLPEEPPVLTEDMLSVSTDRWPLEKLAPLVHPDAHDRSRPKRDDLPVLVLEWDGRHFLIDGINRINRRRRDRESGPHEVIVIHGGRPRDDLPMTTTAFATLWEFTVNPAHRAEFEELYGPDGSWARLFRQAAGYLGTELLNDCVDPLRYVTIDRWQSPDHWREFRRQFAAQYESLDRRCEGLTTHEAALGEYAPVAEP